jgi:hypothetical protein
LIIGGALITPIGIGAAVGYGSVALLGTVGRAIPPDCSMHSDPKLLNFD